MRKVWVAKGLSRDEKIATARAIVYEVSLMHEKTQSWAPAFISTSGFEPSDIPSNVLGVIHWYNVDIDKIRSGNIDDSGYRESIDQINSDLGVYSPDVSYEVYKMYPSTFSDPKYKNKSYMPRWFPTEQYSPDRAAVPSEYAIPPANYNSNFLPWEE